MLEVLKLDPRHDPVNASNSDVASFILYCFVVQYEESGRPVFLYKIML